MRTWGLVLALAVAGGCGEGSRAPAERLNAPIEGPPPTTKRGNVGPDKVVFDHIFISFRGAKGPREFNSRSKDQARRLAESLHDRVESGFDWHALKREYSDDTKDGVALGPYTVVNDGLPYQPRTEIPREKYARGLAARIFALKVGEIELVAWNEQNCPYGWHIVKRIR
ncbi:MAG: peptidyl-prolyl cis-trans isomerase [Planctomycetota bacterium]|nr:peptidyl-prolyl cis-trans isomerase [Planctomycetota bacterium]